MKGQESTSKPPRWSRSTLNFCLDAMLLAMFMVLWFTSLVVHFVFPPATYSQGWMLWGWDQTQWMSFQFSVLVTFTLGILLHVMLHWTWVCGVTVKLFRRKNEVGAKGAMPDDGLRTIYGVMLLIFVLHVVGLAALAAWLTIEQPMS